MANWRATACVALGSVLCVLAATFARGQNAPVDLKEVQVAAGAFSSGDPVPEWVEPAEIPQVTEIKPVIVRLADSQWRVGDTPVVYVRRVIMINDGAALNSAGQLSILFTPQYQHLQLHAIHVLRDDKVEDRTASSAVRFLERETGLEHGVYSGIVTVSILVNDLRIGDTIDLSYSLYGQNPVFGNKFVDLAVWDQGLPTLLRRVVLNAPVARKIDWRLIDDTHSKQLTPDETIRDGMRRLTFEQRLLPETTVDPWAPPDYSPFRVLQFSEFSGWDDVAAWAGELFQVNDLTDGEFEKVVTKLRNLRGSDQRVAAALEFVQSEIRYFSVSLGESSHRPTAPNVVLQRRYGDCKDKSLLLMSLLKALGVESEPVLLDAIRRKKPGKLLPSPLDFNHMIVRAIVDGKTFYLDPTRLGQHGRLDRMGQSHEGADVLVVAPGTRQLSTIVSADALNLARSERTEIATLPKLGPDGTLQTRQTYSGTSAEIIRVTRQRLADAQFDRLLNVGMEARYPGAKLVGEPQVDDDQVNNVISISAAYDVPGLATGRGGSWFVRYLPSNFRGVLLPAQPSNRTAPLAVGGFPLDAHYTFEVKFPEEVSATFDPQSATVQDKQFTYAVTAWFRGNHYKIVIDLQTLADRVETADLKKYGEDLRAANELARGVVLVTKDQIKAPAASDTKTLAEHLREVVQDRIDKYTKAIDSGKLGPGDRAAALCERSANYNFLEKTEEALRDADEALKIAPNNPGMFSCRAEIYSRTGEFDKSIADYSKAITLGGSDAGSLRGRGISEFYTGRLDAAADDFARASAAADKETATYIDLWWTFTLQQLGKPLPETLAKRATEPHGDWPRPALAMLAGNITPEEMLATLDNRAGDDREMALAEANFYLGEHYRALGDNAKAAALFEKTRQSGVIIYLEYISAAFELRRLQEAGRN